MGLKKPRKIKPLTVEDIRKAVKILKKYAIQPEGEYYLFDPRKGIIKWK